MMKRIVLATGGTGGHIFPALAVAEEIRTNNPNCMILFMGSSYGPEADIIAKAGYNFVGLPVRGVVGRGIKGIGATCGLALGIVRALRVLSKVKPEFVLGFGGYAALAGVMAGWIKGIPTGIHEQNAFPGRTNRLLAKLVTRVFLSMPVQSGFDASKTLLVGNPVRGGIKQVGLERNRIACEQNPSVCEAEHLLDTTTPMRLLVMGGSQGAKAINESIVAALPKLMEAGIEIWHQTGMANYTEIRDAYRKAGADSARVEAFIEDMQQAYVWADLAVCRAGGSSIAELAVAGVPSLLVPFPFATHNHQLHNAKCMEAAGAAQVIEQNVFYGPHGNLQRLIDAILGLASNKTALHNMMGKCFLHAKPDAATLIVDEMEVLLSLAMINR